MSRSPRFTSKSQRAKKTFDILEVESHDAGTVLEFYNPLELLIATILSVQTTGKLVNKVTKTLSKRMATSKNCSFPRCLR